MIHSRPWLILLLAAVLFAPFLDKALTIDDPLFVWVAKHISQHPLDPYGFKWNWFGPVLSMTFNVQNPPLTSYWLAMAGQVSWSEIWLHFTMLPWAILLLWGVIRLARSAGADPFWASAFTLGSAAFMVSATNLMCDVMMLALMVWAVDLWVKGLERGRIATICCAGALAGLSALTKYYALAIIPMLLVYTVIWIHRDWLGPRAVERAPWISRIGAGGRALAGVGLGTLIWLALILAWHFWSRHLYGASHITAAAQYAGEFNKQYAGRLFRLYSSLTFLGGCLIWPLLAGIRRARDLIVIFIGSVAGIALLPFVEKGSSVTITPSMYLISAVCCAAGVAVLWQVAVRAIQGRRDPHVILLTMWIAGTLVFVAVVNWTVAARNVLPLVPAVALLMSMPGPVGRSVLNGPTSESGSEPDSSRLRRRFLGAGAILGIAAALLLTWADWAWANSVRDAAGQLVRTYKTAANKLIFQGHWGFQYYMTLDGAEAMDFYGQDVRSGDFVVVPSNNSNTEIGALMKALVPVRRLTIMPTGGLYLNSIRARAGFYSHTIGRLPFAYRETPDDYLILSLGPQAVKPSGQ